MLVPRYLMIGGFLGAGKTTAILELARRLQTRGLRAGLITNDQSTGLVDTAMLGSHGFATEEITGGCFCCKFNSLIEAAERLSEENRPDVFIAEPVGSCTDLRATVSYPLRQMYGDQYAVAPLSVLVDPIRAQFVLGLKSGKNFSPKVVYIYQKQLEEADLVILNKIDLVSTAELDAHEAALLARWPHLQVMRISARTGDGIDAWLARIMDDDMPGGAAMEVDYDEYADGEALLGWLNLTAQLTAADNDGAEFDGNRLLLDLAAAVQSRLREESAEVAHLKMTLTPSEGRDLAVCNLVRNEATAELSHELAEPLAAGELMLNLRAESDPELLRAVALDCLRQACDSTNLKSLVSSVEAFRPGRPRPTHRLASG